MDTLRQQLRRCLEGHVCFIAVGNPKLGDDAFGTRLADKLALSISSAFAPSIVFAGTRPEDHIPRLMQRRYDHVIFLDAVDFGGAAGSLALLDSAQIISRFPQISTHRISLGLLAKWLEAKGNTQAWLLAVQPQSLKSPAGLSQPVAETLEALARLLAAIVSEAVPC